jgi:two-component system cell cycle response regulator DivK
VGQKILVVEDNELNLKLFCDLLRAHGYAVEPVRDGREAVERARAFRPDLVVMDIQMPYISGLELIEQMKADPELRRMPIMAVTAYAAKGDEERIRDAGAEGYVSKPISVVRFVEAVRALLAAPRPEPEPEVQPEDEPAVEPNPHAEPEEVRVSRRFEAPAERVFDAWLDPETAGRWLFATPDGEMRRVAIEPWAGGRWEIVEARGGEDVLHTGTYEAVERPERLAFTLAVPRYGSGEARVAVEIAPEGEGGSVLTLVHTLLPEWTGRADQVAQGWERTLDGLERALEIVRHPGEGRGLPEDSGSAGETGSRPAPG